MPMRLPPCCHQVGEASVQPVSVNLWAGRAVVAEAHFDAHHTLTLTLTLALTLTLPLTLTPTPNQAHFDAHHNVFAQRRSTLRVER